MARKKLVSNGSLFGIKFRTKSFQCSEVTSNSHHSFVSSASLVQNRSTLRRHGNGDVFTGHGLDTHARWTHFTVLARGRLQELVISQGNKADFIQVPNRDRAGQGRVTHRAWMVNWRVLDFPAKLRDGDFVCLRNYVITMCSKEVVFAWVHCANFLDPYLKQPGKTWFSVWQELTCIRNVT